ncbi:phosphatidylglycerophosphate phosphatase 1, chloroplastic [Dioscorea cayenensis subsp. rotundata]|uniref:Phosphatidylglycerophosphate phosphatase 1, chloroplastic n=1 Tax=Dioscorea cayennensis subsp. rotundata TaxID=55577 RepID=A0AB40BXM4_DIOCR|nr:phosphatidylglycerophosphate phosphatase 1, chloroplastic [Dioscorea cayenensis subsp. rotundata]
MSRISLPSSIARSHLSFHCASAHRLFSTSSPSEKQAKITTTMGQSTWSRSLSQRFNPAGISLFAGVAAKHPHLALPHISVPDIRWIDWAELERLGFRGVVFDKDNTITAPYSLSLWPSLSHSFQQCRASFPGKIAVFSNSAGLRQYDPDGLEARALEDAIEGIHVIRHEVKKPSGTAEDIEKYFGCSASLLVMVGDRHFTDVVYGNINGFLTICTEPLTLSGETFIVKEVRKLENLLVNRWSQQGLKPLRHNLLSEIKQCVKPPSL